MRHLSLTASPVAVAVALGAAVLLHLFSGASPVVASDNCANTGSPLGPFEIESYEAADYRNVYARTFELAAFNQLFPEHGSFATPQLETGNRAAGSGQKVAPYIPPVILKSIGYLESGWAQASYIPLVQYGDIGPVLASHDCGYGLMQITSGMQNISGVPNLDQAMIGSHFGFNIARGAAILADKWNFSPEVRPIVGARDPTLIEDWYYSIWGYNGFAFSNHPLNPAYNPSRVGYSCGPAGDGFGHDRSQYPYQELVLGCAQRPPVRAGQQLWEPQAVRLPDLTDPAFAGPLSLGNWNSCAYSLNCASMDMPTPSGSHRDPTVPSVSRAGAIGDPIMSLSSSGASLTLSSDANLTAVDFDVRNTRSGLLSFQVLTDVPWLKAATSVGVALGDDLGGDDGTVQLTVNTAGLAPGQHIGRATISSLYAAGSPHTFIVDLVVADGEPTPSPTSTATPPSSQQVWGDVDCDDTGGTRDSQAILRDVLDQNALSQTPPCPLMGTPVTVGGNDGVWGDLDCDGTVGTRDSQALLRQVLEQKALSQTLPCPLIGDLAQVFD